MSNEGLEDLIEVALESRKRAITFRSFVGAAIKTRDGKIFGGFNIEPYSLKGYHAEEVALIPALVNGYYGTDFDEIAIVYKDAGDNGSEVFPGCPSCWGYLWDLTHPKLKIHNVDTEGTVLYSTKLNEIIRPALPAKVFPSLKTRKLKPRFNSIPKLTKLQPQRAV